MVQGAATELDLTSTEAAEFFFFLRECTCGAWGVRSHLNHFTFCFFTCCAAAANCGLRQGRQQRSHEGLASAEQSRVGWHTPQAEENTAGSTDMLFKMLGYARAKEN
jgi:hypothetical protein